MIIQEAIVVGAFSVPMWMFQGGGQVTACLRKAAGYPGGVSEWGWLPLDCRVDWRERVVRGIQGVLTRIFLASFPSPFCRGPQESLSKMRFS
jgi:hypothetical protein